jgi:hypothetical protein
MKIFMTVTQVNNYLITDYLYPEDRGNKLLRNVVTTYKIIRSYRPEDHKMNFHRREHMKHYTQK